MDVERFWSIIEASRRGFDPGRIDGNMEQQAGELRRLLKNLSPEEIVGFRSRFLEQMDIAFRWDLWAAAHILAGGCSDDGFVDFRSWLISMGRRIFESAVLSPESLVDVANAPGIEEVFFEKLQYVPAQVYEQLTGHETPAYTGQSPATPAGERWIEDGSDLKQRFPKLWARYRQKQA